MAKDKIPRPQKVYTLLVEIGRKEGDGLPKGATGAYTCCGRNVGGGTTTGFLGAPLLLLFFARLLILRWPKLSPPPPRSKFTPSLIVVKWAVLATEVVGGGGTLCACA